MKKMIISGLVFLLLSGGFIFSSSNAQAYESSVNSVQTIFVDTLYGMATGIVLAAAFTAAKGEGHGDEWGENIGAGAVVGGLLGAGFGVFTEYRAVAEVKNNRVCFHAPTFTLSQNSKAGDVTIRTNLLQIKF